MSPESVGSLAEEAAKLVSALSATQAGGHADAKDAGEPHDPLSAECRYCPLCAVVRTARSMTPEVREHLASAATSLLLAARSFVDDAVARADGSGSSRSEPSESPVEKIDLAED
jgi:hypothetical protein